jgi:3-oxoacyl-[acyl-carrier protein] reductase
MNNKQLVFLITGTSRGIGQSIANYYLEKGHKVFGCSISTSSIKHPCYFHYCCDLSEQKEVLEFVRFIRKSTNKLDVLINNAAINPFILPIIMIPTDTLKKVFDVNVLAPMILCRETTKIMKKNKFGRIINIGSMATKHEVIGEGLYTSSKAALNSFTKILSKEVFQYGITANVIAPSVIKTDLSDKINQLALHDILKRNAISEYGQIEDITNIIDFIIDSNSSSVTGQLIYLGGV